MTTIYITEVGKASPDREKYATPSSNSKKVLHSTRPTKDFEQSDKPSQEVKPHETYHYLFFPRLNKSTSRKQCSLKQIASQSTIRANTVKMQVNLQLNKLSAMKRSNFTKFFGKGSQAYTQQQSSRMKQSNITHFSKTDVFHRVKSNKIVQERSISPCKSSIKIPPRNIANCNDFDRKTLLLSRKLAGQDSPVSNQEVRKIPPYRPRYTDRMQTEGSFYEEKAKISKANFKLAKQLYLQMMGIFKGKNHDWLAD